MAAILEIQSTSKMVYDVTSDEQLNRLMKKYEKITKELEILKGTVENASYLMKVPDRIKEIDR